MPSQDPLDEQERKVSDHALSYKFAVDLSPHQVLNGRYVSMPRIPSAEAGE